MTWHTLEILAPVEILEQAEEMVAVALDPADLLGTSRETWRDPHYLPPGEPSAGTERLRVYLAPAANPADCGKRLRDALDREFGDRIRRGEIQLQTANIPDTDWATSWKVFFRPIRVSGKLLILPAWWDVARGLEETGPWDGEPILLRIQPGGAFGSGTHATTQLALRQMEKHVRSGARVLDFGAGSGILSFAAAALGAASVVGVEIEPESLPNFEENRELNPSPVIDYRIGSSERIGADETFDLIVCNALFHRVSAHFETLVSHLAPGGTFLYGGFLHTEEQEVLARLREAGLGDFERRRQEEWAMVSGRKREDRG